MKVIALKFFTVLFFTLSLTLISCGDDSDVKVTKDSISSVQKLQESTEASIELMNQNAGCVGKYIKGVFTCKSSTAPTTRKYYGKHSEENRRKDELRRKYGTSTYKGRR